MKLALTLAAVLSLVTFSASANMLTNGDFETGALGGWNNVQGATTASAGSAQAGAFGVALASDIGTDDMLIQSAALVVGQEYTLTGFYRIDAAKTTATESWRTIQLGFFEHPTWGSPQVAGGNLGVINLAGDVTTDWTAFEMTYTPTTASLANGLGAGVKKGKMDAAISVDSLSLTAVPEPATMSVLALGAMSLIRRRR